MDVDDVLAGTDTLNRRITIVGVQNGERLKPGDEGKVLWIWRGDEGEKEVVEVRPSLNSLKQPDHSIHSSHVLLFRSTIFPIPVSRSSAYLSLETSAFLIILYNSIHCHHHSVWTTQYLSTSMQPVWFRRLREVPESF